LDQPPATSYRLCEPESTPLESEVLEPPESTTPPLPSVVLEESPPEGLEASEVVEVAVSEA
jgi:hypothetical protein